MALEMGYYRYAVRGGKRLRERERERDRERDKDKERKLKMSYDTLLADSHRFKYSKFYLHKNKDENVHRYAVREFVVCMRERDRESDKERNITRRVIYIRSKRGKERERCYQRIL